MPYLGHLLGRVIHICNDAVDVFYCLRWPGYQDSHWRHLIPLQRCSRCVLQSTVPLGHALGKCYLSAEMQSMRSTVHCATRTRVGEVLSLCRDAVDVFYCLSWLGYQDSHWRHLIPLQRCSRCVLQSTVPLGHALGECYLSAEMQSMYFTA